jgi:hypothetical protein
MLWLASSHASGSGSLITLFVHWMVRALAWRAGDEIANLLGPVAVLIIAAIVVVIYAMRRMRNHD